MSHSHMESHTVAVLEHVLCCLVLTLLYASMMCMYQERLSWKPLEGGQEGVDSALAQRQ